MNWTWRSIESAPRDGTEILLGWARLDAIYAEVGSWDVYQPNVPGRAQWRDTRGNRLNSPTHWVPLPELPK